MADLTEMDTHYTPAQEEGDDRNIIRIPSSRLDLLKGEMAKVNRKAEKLGCPPLSFEIIKDYSIDDPRARSQDPDNLLAMFGIPVPKIRMLDIEIKGEGPKIEGWKFLCTFDHVTLPGSVIVNTVPGESIPEEYRKTEPVCDHCGYERRRNETFLLQKEDTGEYKRVGRQCVRDFIGYDAKQIFQFLTVIRRVQETFGDEDFWFGGGFVADMYDLEDILARTAAIIHKEGWVSRTKADFDQQPTADAVITTLNPPSLKEPERVQKAWRDWVAGLDLDNEKWAEEAKAARVWLKEQSRENESEYMGNLHTIDENPNELVPTKLFGYWCSLVAAYQREMEKLREQEKWPKVNEHVGAEKERRNFKVKLIAVRTFEGYHGWVYLHRFVDSEGHTLVWFASREQNFNPGEEYTIVGTVKKHDEYNGWAQTVITRVKEVK